jgi:dTDP-4-amino-4,6-dideoxygalactose transaminase
MTPPVTVPFLRPQLPGLDEVQRYFRLAEEARFYSNGGPCERMLRERLSDYLDGATAIPVNNATSGIMVALLGSTHRAGTRHRPLVVTPSYTFAATAGAVDALGHRPLFVDVDADGWQIDPAALEGALAEHGADVAAVLVTHTFGVPPTADRQDRWRAACAAHGVPLVVDAAAGFGAVDADGVRTGTGVDTHVFSFHATKPFGAGEGGLVTTRDAELAAACDGVRQFGFAAGRVASLPGVNAKLDELHAAVALAVLDGFTAVLKTRRDLAGHYQQHLEPAGFRFQTGATGGTWQAGYVQAPDPAVRDAVLAAGREHGVGVTAYYERPLHRHPAFAGALVHGDLAVTEHLAARALALPMANDLTPAEQARVVEVVLDAL